MKSFFRKLGIAIAWRAALPFACLWFKLHQRRILSHGRAPTANERCLAEALGIEHADRIRFWSVERVPSPGGVLLSGLGRIAGLSTHGAKGMALGHGIYLETAQASRPSLVAHELVHVLQYEKLGGTWPFLRDYLRQCLTEGYWSAPMEIEAREKAAALTA
jgi:hypothetical protein